ncbi:hypothetical protein SVAN01_00530 [Stagonosporopsis vannaccii]|nr:hypothetical protein SVAN01_00530 [Stagonosporopsis vannaccii]
MRHSLTLAAATLASTTTAQSVSSLTFWRPGPDNNPSRYEPETTTFPPVASIISSNSATTIFALGCPPLSTGAPSSIYNGAFYETCLWATDYATYSIISSTRHIMHLTQDRPSASVWWTCDHDVAATKLTCDLEVSGDVLDNTDGPISGLVWGPEPDKAGNVIAFATAEVVTTGRFGELECNRGHKDESIRTCDSNGSGGKGTMVWSVSSEGPASATASEPTLTASEGSGSGAAATASSTLSGSAATASAGVAGRFGVDAVRLAALVGGAAVAAW